MRASMLYTKIKHDVIPTTKGQGALGALVDLHVHEIMFLYSCNTSSLRPVLLFKQLIAEQALLLILLYFETEHEMHKKRKNTVKKANSQCFCLSYMNTVRCRQ